MFAQGGKNRSDINEKLERYPKREGFLFTASGTAENLGWVLAPQNADLRTKLRAAFAAWYDMANNEQDENCCILAIRLTRGTLNINHWEKLYHLDFVNKTDMPDGGVR